MRQTYIAVAKMGTKPVEGSLNSLIKPLKILKNFSVWFLSMSMRLNCLECKCQRLMTWACDGASERKVHTGHKNEFPPSNVPRYIEMQGGGAVFEQQALCKQTFPPPLRYTTGSDIWVEHHYGKTKQTIFVPPKQDAIQHFVAFSSETKYKQVV